LRNNYISYNSGQPYRSPGSGRRPSEQYPDSQWGDQIPGYEGGLEKGEYGGDEDKDKHICNNKPITNNQ